MELRICERMEARILERQCMENRKRLLPACNGCPGLKDPPAEEKPVPPEVKPGEVVFRFQGEDAEVMGQFTALSREQGSDPEEDVATVIELFMAGELRQVKS